MRRSCKQFLDNTAQCKNENNTAQCKPLVPESTSGSIKSSLLNGHKESKEENKAGVTKIQNIVHIHTNTHTIPRSGLSSMDQALANVCFLVTDITWYHFDGSVHFAPFMNLVKLPIQDEVPVVCHHGALGSKPICQHRELFSYQARRGTVTASHRELSPLHQFRESHHSSKGGQCTAPGEQYACKKKHHPRQLRLPHSSAYSSQIIMQKLEIIMM